LQVVVWIVGATVSGFAAGIVAFVAYDRGVASFADRSRRYLSDRVSTRQERKQPLGGERRNGAAMNYGREMNSARALRAADWHWRPVRDDACRGANAMTLFATHFRCGLAVGPPSKRTRALVL